MLFDVFFKKIRGSFFIISLATTLIVPAFAKDIATIDVKINEVNSTINRTIALIDGLDAECEALLQETQNTDESKSVILEEIESIKEAKGVLDEQLVALNESLEELKTEKEKAIEEEKKEVAIKSLTKELKSNPLGKYKITAYDLSVNSCGIPVGRKGYGITANGTNLTGKSRAEAKTIAVDPRKIPLGSKVYIEFPEPYTHFNGVYVANDTGGAIKGKIIDLFMGDFQQNKSHPSVYDFGVRYGNLYLVDEDLDLSLLGL